MNLRLLQIGDSALPISGYTHSWGLEAAIARKTVMDSESLETWTRNWLRYSLAPLEGVFLAAAHKASREIHADDHAVELKRLNRLMTAMMPVPSLRAASLEMGDQLFWLAGTWNWSAQGLEYLFPNGIGSGWHHAIVFGLLGALAESTAKNTLIVYLHQASLGMIGAGARAIPVNHTHGQQILAYLHSEIESLAEIMSDRPVEMAGSGNPLYEVLCDEQTRLYSRMFRS
ncbi:hypothetical protein KIH39_09330 [Telmatocola sphagniphila]|uniref:Urease accessory protein UreF n=1 Tax=Telmatocola sphagniphila TaxID=1123043 RepID=A0A8E6BA54_9BACT|nr:urease accessory UreF family protein [Telmatocola sphagniphila]QVL34089.1 hypothetical protein KIH39_09330 [Telmatocola sphagniphila]